MYKNPTKAAKILMKDRKEDRRSFLTRGLSLTKGFFSRNLRKVNLTKIPHNADAITRK